MNAIQWTVAQVTGMKPRALWNCGPNGKRPLTTGERLTIIRMHVEGLDAEEISTRIGFTEPTVQRVIRDHKRLYQGKV